jgi:hypothetical protein
MPAPLPSSYDEESLALFMVTELGRPGVALGLAVNSPRIEQAVRRTARLMGQEIAACTDMALLEAAALWRAWEAAYGQAINQTDMKAGTASLERSQFFDHLTEQLGAARSAYLNEQARADAEEAAASGTSGGSQFAFGLGHGSRGY